MKTKPLAFKSVAIAVLSVALSIALNTVAISASASQQYLEIAVGGPNPQSPPSIDCVAGKYKTEHVVAEGSDGRFKRYDVTGSHRFNATNTYFDGYTANDNYVHWPITIKVAEQDQYQPVNFEHTERGSLGGRNWSEHNYSINIPSGLSEAQFLCNSLYVIRANSSI